MKKIDDVHVSIQMKIKISRAVGNLNINMNVLTLKSDFQKNFKKLHTFDQFFGNTLWKTSIDDSICSQKNLVIFMAIRISPN